MLLLLLLLLQVPHHGRRVQLPTPGDAALQAPGVRAGRGGGEQLGLGKVGQRAPI